MASQRQIEQALVTLVPSLDPLPTELVNLANALLSQSRSAPPLKADEEIGRAYACAHIACERLKTTLSLPLQPPRPPLPPKVYKRVHAFLTSALPNSSTPRTPRHRDALKPTSTPTSTSRRTRAIPPEHTPSSASPSKRLTSLAATDDDEQALGETGDDTPSRRSEKRARRDEMPGFVSGRGSARRTVAKLRASGKAKGDGSSADMADGNGEATPTASRPSGAGRVATPLQVRDGQADSSGGSLEALRPVALSIAAPLGLIHSSSDTGLGSVDAILAGAGSVVVARASGHDAIPAESLPALLIVLSLLAVAKQRAEPVSACEFVKLRDAAIEGARETAHGDSIIRDLQGTVELVKRFLDAAGTEGWCQGEWWDGIAIESGVEDMDVDPVGPEGDQSLTDETGDEQAENGRSEVTGRRPDKTPLRRKEKHAPRPNGMEDGTAGQTILEEEEENLGLDDERLYAAAGIMPGLGTMFHDGVNWLAPERREEYHLWQRDVLSEIDAIGA